MAALTERRKADRAEMARQVAALALEFDFPADVQPEPTFLGNRATIVELTFPHGLRLSLDFDGTSTQPDTFVVSWHIRGLPAGTTRLAPSFAESVNPSHCCKGTDIGNGFSHLLYLLRRRFGAIADGSAFAPFSRAEE